MLQSALGATSVSNHSIRGYADSKPVAKVIWYRHIRFCWRGEVIVNTTCERIRNVKLSWNSSLVIVLGVACRLPVHGNS